MDDDFDPYNPPVRAPSARRPDPFLVLSRTAWPAKKGRHSVPAERSTVPATPRETTAPRGVLEERSPFRGTRAFAVVATEGERIATVIAVADIVDEAFALGLERLLERYRPLDKLKAI